MGSPKYELRYAGLTFLELAIRVFSEMGIPASVVASPTQQFRDLNVPVVSDRFRGFGPLGGIHAGLVSASAEWGLFLPCDVPFMDKRLPELLCSKTSGSDLVVPVDADGRLHPVCGGYSKRCLPVIEKQLSRGRSKVGMIVHSKDLRVRTIPIAEYGLPDRILTNVNTPADFRRL